MINITYICNNIKLIINLCTYATDIKHCNVVFYVVTTNERRKYIELKFIIIEKISSIKLKEIYPDIITFGPHMM